MGTKPRRRPQAGPGRLVGAGEDEDPERHRLHPRAQVGDEGGRPDEGEVPRAERAERCQGHGARLPARRAAGPRPRPVAAGAARDGYSSSLTLRRGRRANHQMLAMVASTPKAAAGLAILRERSDMGPTLPGGLGRRPRTATGRDPVGPFSSSSSDLLPVLLPPPWVPLRARPAPWGTCTEHLPHQPDRPGRRRADGPALTLVAGTGGAPPPSRDVPPWHPASEGFTPDGTPGDHALRPRPRFRAGGARPPPPSRGSASPDSEGDGVPRLGPDRPSGPTPRAHRRFLEEHRRRPAAPPVRHPAPPDPLNGRPSTPQVRAATRPQPRRTTSGSAR